MSLEEEIKIARKNIVSDGYDMSVGELVNLYKNKEIFINPNYQRLFRWDASRRTRFIESVLLGIPLPPIFVFQTESGIWELIDGLQRLSTLFEFIGVLRGENDEVIPSSTLEGTKFIPSLAGKRWEPTSDESDDGVGTTLQLQIKRARMRIEILKQESDPQAKYELFQRLNTGGIALSEQEVRNCVAIMINKEFSEWLNERANTPEFINIIAQTPTAIEKQAHTELALRFFAFRNVPYTSGLDVHEYLDDALYTIASSKSFDKASETDIFNKTIKILNDALGDNSFRRWNGNEFSGKFLMSLFEVTCIGVSKNIDAIIGLGNSANDFVVARAKELWSDPIFISSSGGGVRGTTRLTKLLPLSQEFFAP